MGEAARRKRQGFDGRQLGEAVLAALNEDAGGEVWGLTKMSAAAAPMFYVVDAESSDVRPEMITNEQAAETPHRVVGLVLVRRGEPWLEAMIFDPCEEYRAEIYTQLQENAVRIARSAMGAEPLDGAWHEIITSSWAADRQRRSGRLMESSASPAQ